MNRALFLWSYVTYIMFKKHNNPPFKQISKMENYSEIKDFISFKICQLFPKNCLRRWKFEKVIRCGFWRLH